MHHLLYLLLGILALGIHSGCSPAASENDNNTFEELVPNIPKATKIFLEDFKQRFEARMASSGCPGAVVTIAYKGEIYSKGFGIKKVGNPDAVNKHTKFRIGSLSKGFAAALASILVQEKILSWQEKIANIIPGFKLKDSAQTSRVNLKHVLSHSTGIQRHAFTNLVEAGVDLDKIIPEFEQLDLISPEGEIYAYSNAPFAMVEKIVETKTNKPFEHLLSEKIFEPAKMKRTSVNLEAIANDPNIAHPHVFSGRKSGYVSRKISDKYYNAISAGGINASGEDMGRWMNTLLGYHPEILSETALNDLFRPMLPTNSNRYYDRWSNHPAQYALGWRLLEFDDLELMHHGGYVNHYRSEIAIDRKNDVGICVLFNASHPEANLIIPDFLDCLRRHLKRALP